MLARRACKLLCAILTSEGVRWLSGELTGLNSKSLKENRNSQASDRSEPSYS